MIEVLTAEDVRRQDAACEARGITTETLMENAGFGVARAARRLLGGTYGRRVVVVCGKGNNGGDGLVAGRYLARWGGHVTAVLTTEAGALKGAPARNLERLRPLGRIAGQDALARELARADLVIDAIFGVGLSRAPEGAASEVIRSLDGASAAVLAVDVPSGVDSDTGQIPGDAVRASATLTLGGLKPGLLFAPGTMLAGRVEVHDIGIPPDVRGTKVSALEAQDVSAFLPRRAPGTHKRAVGTVLVVAGSRAMPGAAALVCGACVHGGAGLTTLAAPEEVCRVVLSRVPEITTIPLPETAEGIFDEKALDLVRPRFESFHAIALGPGLSTHPAAVEAVRALMAETKLPAVIDADGITAFRGTVDQLAARGGPTVVTPHAGELARLLGTDASAVDADRLRVARAAAAEIRAIVLLKGAGTVVADLEGRAYLNTTGDAGLAQGGTGDVLTGLLGALLAQEAKRGGNDWARTAATAAWIHGAAGDLAAERVAPHPANASLLIDVLPEVLHRLA